MPENDLRAFSQIKKNGQNWFFWTLLEKKNMPWFLNRTNVLLWGVIFQLRGQISKIVAGHFEDHKKLGRQPNISKFLATGGLRNSKRRLKGVGWSFSLIRLPTPFLAKNLFCITRPEFRVYFYLLRNKKSAICTLFNWKKSILVPS